MATSSLSSIWKEQWWVVKTGSRDSAAARESSHLETPPSPRVALNRSRVESKMSGREMDWEQGQDISRMQEEMKVGHYRQLLKR